jgi:poly(A) polymerase
MRIEEEWAKRGPAQKVCALLTDAGFHAWFVGGCVRNALIGAKVTDLDICTDALPDTVMALAKAAGLRPIPTGIEHGTVTIMADSVPFEVTTLRRDVATDGRHATVAFTDDLTADARRRDFTMNALYATPDGTVIDPLGGLADLMARRVHFVGDPGARITEDYLRILRFFRFHACYGDPSHGIDAEGLAACAAHLDGLEQLSRERVGAEMRKLLAAPDPAPAMAAMRSCGALLRILPGAGTGLLAVLIHVEQVAGLEPDPIRRLAALGGEDIVQALRLSNVEAAKLARLRDGMENTGSAGALGYHFGASEAVDILALRAASYEQELDPNQAEQARFGAAQTCPVRAADLMPGLQGPALGQALKTIEARWLASHFTLTKAALLG